MKKLLLVCFASLALLVLFSGTASAYGAGCTANNNTTDPAAWNSTTEKPKGLVPCGLTVENGVVACPCELGHLFIMLFRIYKFAVWFIVIPLSAILVIAGGLLILLSGINANWFSTGKTILWNTGIALAIIFCSYIIINTVLQALGYTIAWSQF